MLVYLSILGALAAGTFYVGTEDGDTIHGTEDDDLINGVGGDDLIYGGGGNDLLAGDDGMDSLDGGTGNDTVYGGDGDDLITDASGKNELFGNAGNDTIIDDGDFDGTYGGVILNRLIGGDGNDLLIRGGNSAGDLEGGSGSDILVSNSYGFFEGGEGQDFFLPDTGLGDTGAGFAPADLVTDFTPGEDLVVVRLNPGESAGDYVLEPASSDPTVQQVNLNRIDADGTSTTILRIYDVSPDQMSMADIAFVDNDSAEAFIGSQGDGGPDTSLLGDDDGGGGGGGGNEGAITGTESDDRIIGTYGDDEILGFAGDDFLAGDDGSDTIDGDSGRDTIYAGDGNDLIRTEGAENELYGNDGDDILWATEGGTAEGGAGADYFVAADGLTVVTDFDPGEDTLVVQRPSDTEPFNLRIYGQTGSEDLYVEINGTAVMRLQGLTYPASNAVSVAVLEQGEFETFLNSQGSDGPTLPDGLVTIEAPIGNNPVIGTNGNDLISGSAALETFDGMAGDDTIIGGASSDWIEGNSGNDVLYSGGRDADGNPVLYPTTPGTGGYVDGGDGDDTLFVGSNDDILHGGAGNDVITTEPSSAARGQGGDDFIAVTGAFGTPETTSPGWVEGGEGQDTIAILDGFDGGLVAQMGDGSDALVLNTEGNSNLRVQAFDATRDVLAIAYADNGPVPSSADLSYDTTSGPTTLNLSLPDGSVVQLASFNSLNVLPDLTEIVFVPASSVAPGMVFDTPPATATEGPDTLTGTDGSDTIDGLGGDDVIDGGAGVDILDGGTGNDLLFAGEDTETGGLAPGGLYALDNDLVRGGDGDDTIIGDVRNLTALGQGGNDLIIGGDNGAQRLSGGDGNDTIIGGTATPTQGLYTPNGLSVLDGGNGADVLVDGSGFTMTGGLGADTFIADTSSRIADFNLAEDVLLLTYSGAEPPSDFEISILNQTKWYRLTHLGYDLVLTVRALDGSDDSWTVRLVDDGAQLGPNPYDNFAGSQQQIDAWTARIGFVSANEVAALSSAVA